MKIAVKFCGGCNPAYDRTGAADILRRYLERHVLISSEIDSNTDAVIVIEGCSTACADTSGFAGIRKVILTSRDEIDTLIDIIIQEKKEGLGRFIAAKAIVE